MKYSICNIHLLPKAADLRKKSVWWISSKYRDCSSASLAECTEFLGWLPVHCSFPGSLYRMARWELWLRSWRYCVVVGWDLAAELSPAAKPREIPQPPRPYSHFLEHGSAAKSRTHKIPPATQARNSAAAAAQRSSQGMQNREMESRKRNTESNISDRKLKNFTTLHNLVKSKENLF